jgi:polo-like kinase 4
MHNCGIVHRDLKLSNILISSSQNDIDNFGSDNKFFVKICDFGLAVEIGHPDEEHYTLCGTPNYIAPEIASQQSHGYPADLWSAGCLFYSMATGALPFDQGGIKDTLQKIVSGIYDKPLHLSDVALDFMDQLLELVRSLFLDIVLIF